MKIRERLKKDMKFRIVFVVVVMLVFMGITSQTNQKQWVDQAVCDQYNIGGVIVLSDNVGLCKGVGCNVQYTQELPGILGTVVDLVAFQYRLFGINADKKISSCVSAVPTGYYVLATSKSDAASQCESETASERVKDTLWSDEDVYICKVADPEQACSSGEKTLASMVDQFWKDNGVGCKTKYYMVIFGGGLMLLLVVGVML